MNQPQKVKRDLIEGRPALIVIDIQAETFYDRIDEAIPTMTDYAGRMLNALGLFIHPSKIDAFSFCQICSKTEF